VGITVHALTLFTVADNPSPPMMMETDHGGVPRVRHALACISARRLLLALVGAACVISGPGAASALANKPVAELLPEVVGAPVVGERLVCAGGSWTGVPEFKYQWVREGIPVGFSVSYNVTFADEGQSLWCVVTAAEGEERTEAVSSNSLKIEGPELATPPENTVPPEVSGKAAVGEVLSCSHGEWRAKPTPGYTYQWIRDVGEGEQTIEAAIASTYKITAEDAGHSLACKVTATNSAGSASALSHNRVSVPGKLPENEVPPSVFGVEPAALEESLTCSPGAWRGSPAPSFTYRWVRDMGEPGEALIASGKTYTVQVADQLHSIGCIVIATNSAGSRELESKNTIKVRGKAPLNETPPQVSGTEEVGRTLVCQRGTWSGLPTPTYTFAWVRGLPGEEETIMGATEASYVVVQADQGHPLACAVTATNSEGSVSQISKRVVIHDGHGEPPENVEAPAVSGPPSPKPGQKLACSPGTWRGRPAPKFTYQWMRDEAPIAAASTSEYEVVEADQGHSLSCEVTAINDEKAVSVTSNRVLVPGVAPRNLEAPSVTGAPVVGEVLTCLRGSWSGEPPPTFSYQWLRDGSNISAATQTSYRIASKDRGSAVSCRVSASNQEGSAEATSNSLEIAGGRPQNIEAPEVLGSPAVGATLTCIPGLWYAQPAASYTYQWLLNGTAIPGATATTYTAVSPDRGLDVSCKVTASNREGSSSATSKSVHVPGSPPQAIEAPRVSGTPAVLQQLTCGHGTWNAAPPPVFTYQWLRDGASIAAATSSMYTVAPGDVGHRLSCEVTATNSEGTGKAESANALAIVIPTMRTESSPEVTFPPGPPITARFTAAQIASSLKAQLARAQHHARISSLRRTGQYTISVSAPAAGTLQLVWYQAPPSGHRGAKPLVVAQAATSFSGAATRTVKLRLTSLGKRLIERSASLTLTLKGVFSRAEEPSVSWVKTVVLTY
jgi:hypothetical protein